MNETKIYRFKFSNSFSQKLEQFTRIHKFDKSKDFKEAWNEWKDDNNKLIDDELEYLESKGYKGNIYEKIYKSVRYYHKNKSDKKEEINRKPYIGLNKMILKEMDMQILIHLRSYSKPSEGFQDYMENLEKETLDNEVKNLKNNGYNTKEELLTKFKKTYKNRYFRQTHKSL